MREDPGGLALFSTDPALTADQPLTPEIRQFVGRMIDHAA